MGPDHPCKKVSALNPSNNTQIEMDGFEKGNQNLEVTDFVLIDERGVIVADFVGPSGEFAAELYIKKMKRLMDFGRRALFYIRVLSGYEERKIRNHRLQLEQRLRQAQERKEALRKIPEQFILSEVRRMVEEMQNVNKKIDEIEATFDDYFKPINKQAEIIMKTQLEGEENSMKDMMKAMQTRALLEKFEAERKANVNGADAETKANVNDADADADADQINQETGPTTKQHAQVR